MISLRELSDFIRHPSLVTRHSTGMVVVLILAGRYAALADPIIYVTNSTSNTVSVVDIGRGTIVRRIPVGAEPFGVAFSPDSLFSYVVNAKSPSVSVINTRSERLEQTIPVGGKLPVWLAVSPDGTYIYVTNEGTHNLSVLSTAGNAEVARIQVGRGPAGIVVAPEGRFAYVANEGAHNISVVDLRREEESRTIAVGSVPQGLAISSDGTRVYAANFGSDSVSVIDTAKNEVISEISLRLAKPSSGEIGPVGIAISADSKRAYTGNFKAGSLSVIDTASRQVISHIPIGPETFGVAVDPGNTGVYVTSAGKGQLLVVDPGTLTVTRNIELGKGTFKVAVLSKPKITLEKRDVHFLVITAALLLVLFYASRFVSLSRKQEILLLCCIFLLGLSLRFTGLNWGIPAYDAETARTLPGMRISYHMDEDNYLWQLTRIRPQALDFFVSDFHRGTLQYYLVEMALLAAEFLGFLSSPWRESFISFRPDEYARLFVVGRAVSVLLGSCSIFLVYSIGKRMFGSRAGIWAGLILSLLPLHVVNSHFLSSDITMVFFLLIAFYGLLITLEKPEVGNQFWTGIAFGLAVVAKYNAFFLLPVISLAHFLQKSCSWPKKVWLYFGAGLGFLLGEPYVLLHGREFWETLQKTYHTTAGLPEGAVPSTLRLAGLQLKNMALFGFGVPLSAGFLILGGSAYTTLVRSRSSSVARRSFFARPALTEGLLLRAFLVSFFISLLCIRQPMIRYTLPIVALGVVPISHVFNSISQKKWRRVLSFCCLLFTGLFTCAQVSILIQEHTANQAFRWVDRHLVPGTSIIKGWPEIPVLNPGKYRIRNYYTGERMADFKNFFEDSDGRPFFPDYALVDNLATFDFPNRFLEKLKANYHLVAEFGRDPQFWGVTFPEWDAPHDWKYTHPRITIYRKKTLQ